MSDAALRVRVPFRGRLSDRARWAVQAASDGFERLLGNDGYARCPEHGIDHTGKTARAIVLNCALYAADGEAQYLDRAVRIARLIIGRLGPDPAADDAWIFFPGRHAPANISTNIIDNGECVDALATLLRQAGDDLAANDRRRIEDAIRRCCATYLVANVATKPVINQRLWGAMGLAAAHACLPDAAWAEAVLASVDRSFSELRADGSWPYVVDAAELGEHEGLSDLTVYYHGRTLAFARFALESLERADGYAEPLRRAADFLATIIRPDGVKPLALDGKRWFWDADTESGSAAFDAYALAADGRADLVDLAGRTSARVEQAMGPDGLVDGSPDAPAVVCRVFQTADLAWLARAHEAADLDDLPANPATGRQTAPTVCEAAGVVRLESPRTCAILRTSKRPASSLVGGRVGGGTLVYAGHAPVGWRNVLRYRREPEVPEATWLIDPRDAPSAQLPGGRRGQWSERRFRLHVARLHWRAGRRAYALKMCWRFLGPPAWRAEQRWLSSQATTANVEPLARGVTIRSQLSLPGGETLPGVRTTRTYVLDRTGLLVDDQVHVERVTRGACYRLPAAAATVDVEAGAGWRLDGDRLRFGPLPIGSTARVRYRL